MVVTAEYNSDNTQDNKPAKLGTRKIKNKRKQRTLEIGQKPDLYRVNKSDVLAANEIQLRKSEEEYTNILAQIDKKYEEFEIEKKKLQKYFDSTIQELERKLDRYRENIVNLSGTLKLPIEKTVLKSKKIKSGTKAVKSKTDSKKVDKTKGVRSGDSR